MATKKELAAKEKEIQKSIDVLGITREEAEEMWAFDHDEIECAEVEAIETRIKDNTPKGSPLDKVKHMKAKKKADAEKQGIIKMIFDFVMGLGAEHKIINPQEMGTTKVSFKGTNGGYYTVTITKHKIQPDGYKDT